MLFPFTKSLCCKSAVLIKSTETVSVNKIVLPNFGGMLEQLSMVTTRRLMPG